MTPYYRPLLLGFLTVAASFLFLEACLSKSSGSQLESFLVLIKEAQREEALNRILQHTHECCLAKRAIILKVISRQLTLKEALPAFSEVHARYLKEVERVPNQDCALSRKRIYERILEHIRVELWTNPSLAYAVKHRLQNEWASLSSKARSHPAGEEQ